MSQNDKSAATGLMIHGFVWLVMAIAGSAVISLLYPPARDIEVLGVIAISIIISGAIQALDLAKRIQMNNFTQSPLEYWTPVASFSALGMALYAELRTYLRSDADLKMMLYVKIIGVLLLVCLIHDSYVFLKLKKVDNHV